MDVDLSELQKTAAAFDERVNHLVEEDPKLKEVIGQMEQIHRQTQKSSPGSRQEEDLKNEEKVIYIQAFLKKPEDGEKKEP